MNRGFKLFFLALLIVSIAVQAYSIYAHATAVKNGWKSGSWCYRVHPLDYIADDCWNLTDPDQYILEAIQDVGEWTLPFDYRDSTFWFIAPWYDHLNLPLHDISERRPKPFLYDGTCYDYDVTYAGTYIVVEVLSEPPEKYWNVTNPDKRLLKGIKNLGKDILIPWFSDETLGPRPFRYNGTYYDYRATGSIDFLEYPLPKPVKPEHTAMALAVVWVAVGSVYILRNRKTTSKRTRIYLHLRAHLSVLKNALVRRLTFAYETAKATLTVVAIFLFIAHPGMVLSYFVAINQIGNILLNYTLLGLFILDIAASCIGSILMKAKREGIF